MTIKEDNFGFGAAETDTIVLTYSTKTTERGRRNSSQFCSITFNIDCGNTQVGTRTHRMQSFHHKYGTSKQGAHDYRVAGAQIQKRAVRACTNFFSGLINVKFISKVLTES